MTGYSATPLARKLGLRAGLRAVVLNPPADYRALIGAEGAAADWTDDPGGAGFVHLFVTTRAELAAALPRLRKVIDPDGAVWTSWPKRAAKTPTDLVEDVIREIALPLGFVDVKVCAVDATWSGLKLVIRRELRRR